MSNRSGAGQSYDFGSLLERELARVLRGRGYLCDVIGGRSHEADLLVKCPETARAIGIEVKASRLTHYMPGDLGYQFLLFKAGASRPIEEPLTVLACVDRPGEVAGWFVIPTKRIGSRHKIAIPNPRPDRYGGKWKIYFNRFDLIDRYLRARALRGPVC